MFVIIYLSMDDRQQSLMSLFNYTGMHLQSILSAKKELKKMLKMNRGELVEYITNSDGFEQLQTLETLSTKTKEECQLGAIMALFTDKLQE